MTRENPKISKNFHLSEFKFIMPEKILLKVLESLRKKTKNSIFITDSARTFEQHVDIYKNLGRRGLLDKPWYDVIPLNSRHLPKYNAGLRAVDFKCVKSRNSKGDVKDFYSGLEILDFLLTISHKLKIHFGIGVGKEYCHLDIDRQKNTVWYYDY